MSRQQMFVISPVEVYAYQNCTASTSRLYILFPDIRVFSGKSCSGPSVIYVTVPFPALGVGSAVSSPG